jgi:hypothetical protein
LFQWPRESVTPERSSAFGGVCAIRLMNGKLAEVRDGLWYKASAWVVHGCFELQ